LLRGFLRDIAGRSFRLGTHDCGLVLADWVEHVTGRDPAAPVRGRYAGEAELMAIAGAGGLPRLFDRLLRAGGLERTRAAQLGDVAIVSIDGAAPRGAIYARRGFIVVAPQGVSRCPPDKVRVVMAWTFNA
jgi:hypothetical protein